MFTWHIHIQGQVQGVGFRPFVFNLAQQENVNGWVSNSVDGVHIEINGSRQLAEAFLEKIRDQAPAMARITTFTLEATKDQAFQDFRITESEKEGAPSLLISPDFAMCDDCREELLSDRNRRGGYPFTTCTNCGPRYAITKHLPYDRETTSMDVFPMCEECVAEYNLPIDRRYYSQTNSCPKCAIQLSLIDPHLHVIAQDPHEVIDRVCQFWRRGDIVAIKGIGGYLLTCDASNESAILALRERKHRPTKPFALMFPNSEALEKEMIVSRLELEALQSIAAPIVILESPKNNESELQLEAIAPNLDQLGVMLPYTPLFELLLKQYDKTVIATSGNISNSPIIYEERKISEVFGEIADATLTDNRNIVVPQDDSVIRFSYLKKHKIILRRSRGIAPSHIHPNIDLPRTRILAAGAMLKSTFTFLHNGNTFVSQYLGDLGHFETEENYRHTVQHFFHLFRSEPDIILCDLHPNYPSTRFAEQLSKESKRPLYKIQHHKAHFAALLGEHNACQSEEPILGVIWDGTGLGEDGNIWGGEFFIYEDFRFTRCGHLSYFDFFLGDKMPKEPRIAALSLASHIPMGSVRLEKKFDPTEWKVYKKLLAQAKTLQSSSMGRLFDAVASLLDVCDTQSFEGEAAMRLENLALEHIKTQGLEFYSSYVEGIDSDFTISADAIIAGVLQDIRDNKPKSYIAATFHFSLVQAVKAFADNFNIQKIAFSGGVFQNGVLVDMLIHYMGENHTLLFHRDLSPNDENISFGQLIYYHIHQNLANN